MRRVPRVLRHLAVAATACVLASARVGAAGITSERLLARILTETPSAILVPAGQQWQRAEAAAAETAGAMAFWGVGKSMEPLFPDKTAIVVAPVPFENLRRGMTVLYVARHGGMVAHSLTGDVPDGWIAQGVNNRKEDDDLVTRQNLVGVIVEAYSEIPSTERMALTSGLVAKGRLPKARS